MTGDHAVLQFWEDTTRGYLDFADSSMFPWVDMTIGTDTSRDAQARAAVDALRARFPNPPEWPHLDGLIVITHPGQRTVPNPRAGQPGQDATITQSFDAGSSGVDGLPVAVLPVMGCDLTFMCHETGHVLGLDHTFGLDNNGTDWDPSDATIIVGQEYGSPYDLMSSATFGARFLGPGPFYSGQPTFTGPAVTDWPYAGASAMGPHLSPANLHLFMPDALAARMVEVPFPRPGVPVAARIVPASARQRRAVDRQPTFAWTVGGASLRPPNGYAGVTVDGKVFTVGYTLDPATFELTLTSRGGERYEAPAVMAVSGDGTTASATAVFTAQGWTEGIDPDDAQKLGGCLSRITQKYKRVPAPFRRPTPAPGSDLATRRLAEQAWLREAFRLIARPPDLDAAGRGELSRLLQLQAPPTAFIDALGEAAVDYSVPEADLTDWLRNPEFTPYPALAQSLLLRLDSTRLKRPVFLDVIAFNYETSPGKPSPRRLEDVHTGVLEAAVVKGWNVRYGEKVSKFGDLLA